jgi:hypothetical protein
MTTPTEAIAAYRQYQARVADDAADPPAAAGRPAPDPTQKAAAEHAVRLLVPSYRQAEQQRAAAAAAERQTALPEPRELLRKAHAERADTQAETDRLRSAADRAREHLSEVTATRDAAKESLEAVEADATARLIDELASGQAGRVVERVAGEKRVALAEIKHQFKISSRAADKLAGDLAGAEGRLASAGRAIADSVCAVLLEIARHEAEAILHDADELDARRANLDALGFQITNLQRTGGTVRTAWPPEIRTALSPELRGAPRLPSRVASPAGSALVQRWAEVARALTNDPEAEIG